jgi:hypothetical protein
MLAKIVRCQELPSCRYVAANAVNGPVPATRGQKASALPHRLTLAIVTRTGAAPTVRDRHRNAGRAFRCAGLDATYRSMCAGASNPTRLGDDVRSHPGCHSRKLARHDSRWIATPVLVGAVASTASIAASEARVQWLAVRRRGWYLVSR